MYSKLSYLFLVGLISQSIAAPNSLDEYTADEARKDFHLTRMRSYVEECVRHENYSNFDLKLLESQINESYDIDNSLSSHEIAERVETVFDNLIDGLGKDNFKEIVEQANYDLKFVVMSGKKSDLHQIVKIVAKSSKKFMELIARDEDFDEIRSLNYEFMKAVMLKEYPELFRFLLDFLQKVMDVINRYQESDDFNEVARAHKSIIEQTRSEINNTPNVSGDKIFKSIVISIDRFADETSFMFGMDISDDYKLNAVRCLAEDTVGTMLVQAFMIEFRSAIDS